MTFERLSLLKCRNFHLAFSHWCHHWFFYTRYFSTTIKIAKYFIHNTYVTRSVLHMHIPRVSRLKLCISSVSSAEPAPQNKLCWWCSPRCPDIFPLAYSTYGAACIWNSRCFPYIFPTACDGHLFIIAFYSFKAFFLFASISFFSPHINLFFKLTFKLVSMTDCPPFRR